MDNFEYQNKQALVVNLNNFEILKIITQLLFSVSVFAIFFAQSSWLTFSRLSSAIDKNYIFLLCNGLLVFLAKYSGLIRSLSSSNRNDEILRAYENISLPEPLMAERETPLFEREASVQRNGSAPEVVVERETPLVERKASVQPNGSAPEVVVERETAYPVMENEEEGRRSEFYEENAEIRVEENDSLVEEEEEDENEMLSAEELNRKFDDFIRRTKEEIRTQAKAQRQLVLISRD